jgi:hypothetical protein
MTPSIVLSFFTALRDRPTAMKCRCCGSQLSVWRGVVVRTISSFCRPPTLPLHHHNTITHTSKFLPVLARPFSLMLQHTIGKFYRSHLLRRVAWAWARGQLFEALDRRKASPLHDHLSATFIYLPKIEGGTNSKFQLTVLVCEVALLRYPPWC